MIWRKNKNGIFKYAKTLTFVVKGLDHTFHLVLTSNKGKRKLLFIVISEDRCHKRLVLARLPVSKECARELGAEDEVAAFVLPLGATINMDGTAIYQCVATIFLASCCGMTLTLGQMITVVVTATLASIGTAGVSGAGMIMLAMVLEAMGIPVDMIMIIYGVDRLFDMGRTMLNVTGDIACSTAVSQWEAKRAAKAAK